MTLNTLSDPQFTLDKETHTYSHKDYPEAEFQSVTTVVGDHFEIFDAPRIAENLVTNNPRYSGMTVEELMGKWNESSRLGTRIHEEIELFIYDGRTPTEQKAKIGLNWLEQFKMKSDFEILSEVMVYSMELKIAGTIDILAHDLKTGNYELIDWKSSKKIQTESYRGKVGTSPVTRDIQDCNFNHYALQLSLYRYLLEEYYSITVSNQMIAHLTEDKCHSIVTPYMKDHIHAMVNQKARTQKTVSFIATVEKIDDKVVLYKYDGEGLAPSSGGEPELETPNQKRLCFLDVETTGKDRTEDEIIEIALKTILFDMASCSIASVKESYESYNEPTIPIKEEAFLVNQITDEMVRGESIDWHLVDGILEKADVIVAHNASFDRAFIDEHSSVSPRKIWACSLEDIDWPGRNFSNGKQELLCFWHGFYYESHRAMNDVNALIHLVTHPSYMEGHPILELIENSGKTYYKMKAIRSPFQKKDTLKANNYKWDGGNKYWWKKLNFDEIETEKDWLTEMIYDDYFLGVVEEIPLTDKYKQ